MKMKKWGICLTIVMLLCTWTQAGGSITVYAAEESGSISQFTQINPLYEEVLDEEDLHFYSNAAYAVNHDIVYETDSEAIAEKIRTAMVDRSNVVTIYYKSKTVYTEDLLIGWVDKALEETDQPNEGDYLQWSYGGYSVSGTYKKESGYYKYTFTYQIDYYTTAEQEQQLERAIDAALTELKVRDNRLSDYQKAEKIYRYIADRVSYDFKHMNDESYMLQYTAYAAMINKTAVCQGYATLLYYMLEDVGVDCRVIHGVASGGAHGWNIVGVDGVYYWVDITWDAGEDEFDWFLLGTEDFKNHTAQSDFLDQYRISDVSYIYKEPIVEPTPEPTPTPTPTPEPTPEPMNPFTDVYQADWYYDSVNFVYGQGIMTGMNTDSFGPMESLSRAQFAVMLYRMEGCPTVVYQNTFADIAEGLWYTDAVLWAYEAGIVNGYESGCFGPADLITREQLATMLYRYAKYIDCDAVATAGLDSFTDAAAVSSFATESMSWAVGRSILTGKDAGTRLAPQDNTARAECAAMITRFIK